MQAGAAGGAAYCFSAAALPCALLPAGFTDSAPACRREPREGQRLTLTAEVAAGGATVQVYSAHLEVFCGAVGRLRQFADILEHSRSAARRGVGLQVIGGDLNTMGHGVARLSPFHCTDRLRWATVGETEASFWARSLFAVPDSPSGPVRALLCLPACLPTVGETEASNGRGRSSRCRTRRRGRCARVSACLPACPLSGRRKRGRCSRCRTRRRGRCGAPLGLPTATEIQRRGLISNKQL